MYHLYIQTEKDFSPKKIGEYKDLSAAEERLEKEQLVDNNIKYRIEETTGSIDSYGELLTYIVDEG